MDDCDLVVVLQGAVAERLENTPDAAHTEAVQLRRPQRAHAGTAEDVNALRQRPQYLLVPDRGRPGEKAIDDADRARPSPRNAIDVALRDRRQANGVA